MLLKTGAEVFSIERLAGILDKARQNLRQAKLVHARLVHGDGHLGLPDVAPFDGIIITAAARQVPPALLAQLADNGRLVLAGGRQGAAPVAVRENSPTGCARRSWSQPSFVPLLPGKQ